MKIFIMVGLFIFLFFAPISNAQTEKLVGDNLTTAPSDSFWRDYVSQVVVLMCSTLITLLALIKKTWNDDKYIPFLQKTNMALGAYWYNCDCNYTYSWISSPTPRI